MNNQVSKTIRKWATLRSLDYDACKRMFKHSSFEDRRGILEEATKYIDAVGSGRIKPSKPKLID